jgi:hypothetical protein
VLRSFLLAIAVALAPMQCQGSEDPSLQRTENPGEALYDLAQEFRAKGQSKAYEDTLRFLIARYPSSRRAVTARSELEAFK